MSQPNKKTTLKSQIYEKLKQWDKQRAQNLKSHQKTCEQVLQAIETKLDQSKSFSTSLLHLFTQRINQLVPVNIIQKSYCENSVMDSDFVIDKNKSQAYSAHYQVLKYACSLQADLTNEASRKYGKLCIVFWEIFGSKEQQVIKQMKGKAIQINYGQISSDWNESNYSQIESARQNIRYGLEYELAQIVGEVIRQCEKVSKTYNENLQKDLYIQIQQFIHSSQRQVNKHKKIGKQILMLIESCVQKQSQVHNKLHKLLKVWSQIDGPIDDIFLVQLTKTETKSLAKDYFNFSHLQNCFNIPTEQFLTKQISQQQSLQIPQFTNHKSLIKSEVYGIYNNTIETKIIVTVDSFMHLIRLNSNVPDFSILLNDSVQIGKKGKNEINLKHFKKKFYFRKEKQFEFDLKFEDRSELVKLIEGIQKNSLCKVS